MSDLTRFTNTCGTRFTNTCGLVPYQAKFSEYYIILSDLISFTAGKRWLQATKRVDAGKDVITSPLWHSKGKPIYFDDIIQISTLSGRKWISIYIHREKESTCVTKIHKLYIHTQNAWRMWSLKCHSDYKVAKLWHNRQPYLPWCHL